jgi:hypothetical protein
MASSVRSARSAAVTGGCSPLFGRRAVAVAAALPSPKLGLAQGDLLKQDLAFPGQGSHFGAQLPFGVSDRTFLAAFPGGAGALPVKLALPLAQLGLAGGDCDRPLLPLRCRRM